MISNIGQPSFNPLPFYFKNEVEAYECQNLCSKHLDQFLIDQTKK